MDPNYDDWNDFHGTSPSVQDKVREYLKMEWTVDLDEMPHEIHESALQIVEKMREKDNIPNIAARIAMEIVPLWGFL